MKSIDKRVAKKNLITDTRGANIVEYIILVGVVALIAIAGFKIFGTSVEAKITEQGSSVDGINGAAK
jgi:pilus assembly protein Flp/PilA